MWSISVTIYCNVLPFTILTHFVYLSHTLSVSYVQYMYRSCGRCPYSIFATVNLWMQSFLIICSLACHFIPLPQCYAFAKLKYFILILYLVRYLRYLYLIQLCWSFSCFWPSMFTVTTTVRLNYTLVYLFIPLPVHAILLFHFSFHWHYDL